MSPVSSITFPVSPIPFPGHKGPLKTVMRVQAAGQVWQYVFRFRVNRA